MAGHQYTAVDPVGPKPGNVVSLDHSTSAGYLDNNQIRFAAYPSVKASLEGLVTEKVDASPI